MNEQKFHEKHPYLFVGLLEVVVVFVALIIGTIVKKFHFPVITLYGGFLLIMAVVTAIILNKLKWWRKIGFRRFEKKFIYLLVIPSIPMIGTVLGSYKSIGMEFYIYYLLMNILVGFVEEGIYRGIMVRVLVPKGVWKAVIISSLIFSLTHIMNALVGWNWQHVALQLCYAFAIGFGWAAFALRTGTIWPLMLIHFLIDFFSFIKSDNLIKSLQSSQPSLEGIIYDVGLSIVFIIYGVIVTRSYIRIEIQKQNNQKDQ